MSRLFMVLVAAVGFSTAAQASDIQCVPTQTVETARVILDNGTAVLQNDVLVAYKKAELNFKIMTAVSLAKYNDVIPKIETQYQNEVAQIKKDLNLGWQEALIMATNKHNQAVAMAQQSYNDECASEVVVYDQAVANAQAIYVANEQILVDQYNTSVCAVK